MLVALSLKELRRRWGFSAVCGLSLFASSISVILLLSISKNYQGNLKNRSKELLGADFVISSRTKPTDEALTFIKNLPGFSSEQVQTNTMLSSSDSERFRIAQVRGIEASYPLYGKINSEPEDVTLSNSNSAILDESLKRQLDLKLGDKIHLGKEEFVFKALLKSVPGEVGVFGLVAPRVYLSLDKLRQSGLLEFGSQARYRYLFKEINPDPNFEKNLQNELKHFQLEFESARERESTSGRLTANIEAMLKLSAMLILALGVLGYGTALQFDLKRRISSLRTLLLLGLKDSELRTILVFGSLLNSLLIAISSGLVSILLLPIAYQSLKKIFPINLELNFDLPTFLATSFFGLFIALWGASTVSLPAVTRLSETLREESIVGWIGRIIVPVLFVLFVAAIFLNDFKLALEVSGALLIFSLVVFVFTSFFTKILEGIARYLALPIKFGILLVTRRKTYYLLAIISVVIATTTILTLSEFKSSIVEQLRALTSGSRPNSFLFDIQTDQLTGVLELTKKYQLKTAATVPVITMRLIKVDSDKVQDISSLDSKRAPWVLRREYRTTYREKLQNSEKIVAGEFISQASPQGKLIPISLEEKIAKDLNVSVGSTLDFDIQGVEVKTIVSSIRIVDWKSGDINFFITFPVGVLENAPHYYALLSRFDSAEQFLNFEKELNSSAPNVSIIDLREIFNGIEDLLKEIGTIAASLAYTVLLIGTLILATSILGIATAKRKIDELLTAIGAGRLFKFKVLLVENFILALVGVSLGVLGSIILNELLIVRRFELPRAPLGIDFIVQIIFIFSLPFVTGLLMAMFSDRSSCFEKNTAGK